MVHRLLTAPLPWHLLLAPAVPFGALQISHLDVIQPDGMVWPTVAAGAVAVTAWLTLASLLPSHRSAALVVTLTTFSALSYRQAGHFAGSLSLPGGTLLLDGAAIVAILWVIRRPDRAVFYTRWANQALCLILLLLAGTIAHAEWSRPRIVLPDLEVRAAEMGPVRPDVYVLVLDGYGRADVLRQHYGFENTLVHELRTLGFFVADTAATNYAQTALSLASSLNLDYLQALVPDIQAATASRRGMADMIADNHVFSIFRDAGYQVHAYASAYKLLRLGPADVRRAPFVYVTSFGLAAYETTSMPRLFELAGLPRGWLPLYLHRRHVRWTLDDLARQAAEASGPPRFVFAHVLAPHPPFAFGEDGSGRSTALPALGADASHWRALAAGSGETYESGYLSTVRFLNHQVIAIARAITERADRPSVVLIHSDHGPGAHLDWERPEISDLRERLGILLAVRFPEGLAPSSLPPELSTLNAYRVLLNQVLGLQLPLLEDRSYFSTWSKPFAYIDATDYVQQRGE